MRFATRLRSVSRSSESGSCVAGSTAKLNSAAARFGSRIRKVAWPWSVTCWWSFVISLNTKGTSWLCVGTATTCVL